MRRPTLNIALAVLGLSLAGVWGGCGAKDPLEMRVSARNADDYNVWVQEKFPRLPEGIAAEYAKAFALIAQTSPMGSSRSANPGVRDGSAFVCEKVDGRTVRQVIVDGYVLANKTLQFSISNELDNIKRALTRSEAATLSAADSEKLQKSAEQHLKLVEKMREQIAANKEMIERYSVRT